MLAVSLTSLIEAAAHGDDGFKRLSGQVLDPAKLFDDRSLRALEDVHGGIFGFLAFDPAVDTAVMEYLAMGSLADDSGSRLLVLFTTARPAAAPLGITGSALDWITIKSGELPAARFLRSVFRPKQTPPLPGLLIFESITETCRPVYFDLAVASGGADVAATVRSVAVLASEIGSQRTGRRGDFGKSLAVEATRRRISFQQSGSKPLRQHLVETYRFASEHSGDIVSAIGLGM